MFGLIGDGDTNGEVIIVSPYKTVDPPGVTAVNVTTDYGLLGVGPVSGTTTTAFNSGAFADVLPQSQPSPAGRSGVYSGSLSAQGSMVAMQLNKGGYQILPVGYGSSRFLEMFQRSNDSGSTGVQEGEEYFTVNGVNYPVARVQPYLTGYMRQYWRDPVTTTFGSNSAIPALTGVVPEGITSMPGILLYYIDLQLTRVTGSNYFDLSKFLNTFNQSLGWLYQSNSYLAALKTAGKTNLEYYGATDYKSFVSQGFNKYKQGKALIAAIRNQGSAVQYIDEGYFGTPNSLVKVLVNSGLGYINNLSTTLVANGVTLEQIYDSANTPLCTQLLQAITNADDLLVIQSVLDSSIPNITSAMDYCSIETASGLPNDSAFKTLADFGKDIYDQAPNLIYKSGAALATMINNVQTEVSDSVESLSAGGNLLPDSVINSLRQNLPTNGKDSPISILDLMGLVSGYITEPMSKVNEGIGALYATSYGPRIRTTLSEISRYDAKVALSQAEAAAAARYQTVPPTVYDLYVDEQGIQRGSGAKISGGPDYWEINRDAKIKEYYAILNEIANDNTDKIKAIFNLINDNYNIVCEFVNSEYQNYAKAGANFKSYQDNSQIFNFVLSLPQYAADNQNIGTDTLLYKMAQPNSAGDLVKATMAMAKNNQILGESGVRIKGQI